MSKCPLDINYSPQPHWLNKQQMCVRDLTWWRWMPAGAPSRSFTIMVGSKQYVHDIALACHSVWQGGASSVCQQSCPVSVCDLQKVRGMDVQCSKVYYHRLSLINLNGVSFHCVSWIYWRVVGRCDNTWSRKCTSCAWLQYSPSLPQPSAGQRGPRLHTPAPLFGSETHERVSQSKFERQWSEQQQWSPNESNLQLLAPSLVQGLPGVARLHSDIEVGWVSDHWAITHIHCSWVLKVLQTSQEFRMLSRSISVY